VAALGKEYLGAWPLIISEATTAKRNFYYRTSLPVNSTELCPVVQ